jgi:16S rRNA (cytidine1402-2'-O)-methyltransferase
MEKRTNSGHLYIVATPIGNIKDITLRALDILKGVDAVICEEYGQGSKLLHRLGIEGKDILTLNEHNEAQEAQNIAIRLNRGEDMALISDAGTPVFADPGQHLLELLYDMNIPISPIPGPGSLLAALSLCDFSIDQFLFAGFPPRDTRQREKFLGRYRSERMPVILMDTPYRLTKLLEEVISTFGREQEILLACDMTLKSEVIYRGRAGDILPKVAGQKREFILVLDLNQRKNQG